MQAKNSQNFNNLLGKSYLYLVSKLMMNVCIVGIRTLFCTLLLNAHLREARRKNQRAFLRFDKLVIYDNQVNSGSTNGERVSGESSNAD